MKYFLSFLIIICSLGIAYGLYSNKPVSKKKTPKMQVPVVKTMALAKSTEKIYMEAFGSVVPARKLELRTEVNGRVIALHPDVVPGGIVKKGELLVEVDSLDYELIVSELQAEVAKAEYDLELEKGQQVIAKQEWRLLEKDIETTESGKALALREPHLRQAKIKLEAAKSKLEAAKLDVSRTKLRAPFHGLVLAESVEEGQLINSQNPIITLVDIDTFWVQATLPSSLLDKIQFSDDIDDAPKVEVVWEQDSHAAISRQGKVFKLLGNLEEKGRMAQILITLHDPFNLSGKYTGRILLGSFVKIRIEAGILEDVYVIPRGAVQNGYLWVVNQDHKLQKIQVDILWRRVEELLVKAEFPENVLLVNSRILSPLPGMRVMTAAEDGAGVRDIVKE